jgi:hypothetical protein
MPAFGGVLSGKQIWAALSEIERTWPPDNCTRQACRLT